jgi:hypothetical protein
MGLSLLPHRPCVKAKLQVVSTPESIMNKQMINILGGAAVGGVIGHQVDPHKK